jgi:hypothetical protein
MRILARLLASMRNSTVARAQCPACEGTVFARMRRAWHMGGDGLGIKADRAGEIVQCCTCGHILTVLASGVVLKARAPEPPKTSAPRAGGAGDGRGWGLDSDVETLTLD